jgi:hypothetical protein
MATFNGIGTGLLGWRHQDDGLSTATLWFTVVYLPVIPLRRFRVRNLTDFDAERSPTWFEVVAALGGGVSWTDPVDTLERLPLSWREIAGTYLRCYALIPLLCLWPVAVVRFLTGRFEAHSVVHAQGVQVAFALLCLANMVLVLLFAVRRMRGYGSCAHAVSRRSERSGTPRSAESSPS